MESGPRPRLRLYLVGNVAVEQGDVLVPERRLVGRQGRLSLALLAAERDRALTHEEMADVLWNGSPPRAWATALRALVSKVRSVVSDAGVTGLEIESAFGCYQLRLREPAWVDLEAAAEAVHAAETALAAGRLAVANGEALVANAVARRPFLPAESGPWVQRIRARMHDIRVRALECRADIALRKGDAGLAAADAETVVGLEPYRESAHEVLMRAHVAAGNPAEALRAFERLRRLLAEELGADPSPAVRALHLEILGSSA